MATARRAAAATPEGAPEDKETPPAAPEGEGLVEQIRSVVGEVLGGMFDRGEAHVSEGSPTPAPEKSLTLADVERVAAEKIRAAQDSMPKKEKKETAPAAPSPEPPQAKPTWQERLWGDKRSGRN